MTQIDKKKNSILTLNVSDFPDIRLGFIWRDTNPD